MDESKHHQNNLEQVREQFKTEQQLRDEEVEWLNHLWDVVENLLEQLEEGWKSLEGYSLSEAESNRRRGAAPSNEFRNFERYYWDVVDRKFRVERRLHDLKREERDDLDRIGRLEGRIRARERASRGDDPRQNRNEYDRNRTNRTVNKNRQHKNRASKRHDSAPNASSTQ